jgi:dTDP-4-dehydrorhamnose reductase
MTSHLVLGAGGQIGSALSSALRTAGDDVIATARQPGSGSLTLDLAALGDQWQPPRAPDVVYLCAAMTSLAACENDPARARAINVEGPARLSGMLARTGAFCVFLSSNAVFDGTRPYPQADEPTTRPANVYGRLKAEAEAALFDIWRDRLAVLRLTKVFHAKLPLAARWAADLAEKRPIAAFEDMVFAPISMQATVAAIRVLGTAKAGGIYHLSGERDVSYLAAAKALARAMGALEGLVRPGSWREVPGLVAPPPATALGMGQRERALNLLPQPLSEVTSALAADCSAIEGPRTL